MTHIEAKSFNKWLSYNLKVSGSNMSPFCVKLSSLISQPFIKGFGFNMGHLEALTNSFNRDNCS